MHGSTQQPSPDRGNFNVAGLLLLSLLLAALLPGMAAADDHDDDDDWIKSRLSGTHQEQQFVAGERVEVSNASVSDDIFAAGGDLRFDTVSAKLLVAAGGSLWLRNVTAEDLILAGGQADISGEIKDDVIAAVCPICPMGGRLHLGSDARVGDDARLAGREVIIDGRVGGDLFAAGRHVELTGQVSGNARIEAEKIVLGPDARIGGDLRYAAAAPPELRQGAVVAGQIIQVESRIPIDEEGPEHPVWIVTFAILAFLLALLLLGIALQLAVPAVVVGATAAIDRGFWAVLGRGLVLALLGPAAAGLLMATVIGAPIGMVVAAALALLFTLAFVTISYRIGLYVRRLFSKSDGTSGTGMRMLWTVIGILLLVIVGIIPLLGWAIGVLAIICGLGAVMTQLGPVFRRVAQ